MSLAEWAGRRSTGMAGAYARVDAMPYAWRNRAFHPFQSSVEERDYHAVDDYARKVGEQFSRAQPRRVDIASLSATQKTVNPDVVKQYIREHGDPVRIVEYGGKRYIYDGHHRTTAEWARGSPTVLAVVARLDGAPSDA